MSSLRLGDWFGWKVGICDAIFYDSNLICGPGKALTELKRQLSDIIQHMFKDSHHELTKAPAGKVHPIFYDVQGICTKDTNSNSKVNAHNISFIFELMISMHEALEDDYRDAKNRNLTSHSIERNHRPPIAPRSSCIPCIVTFLYSDTKH